MNQQATIVSNKSRSALTSRSSQESFACSSLSAPVCKAATAAHPRRSAHRAQGYGAVGPAKPVLECKVAFLACPAAKLPLPVACGAEQEQVRSDAEYFPTSA
mmetsp:Transcript_115525/g.224773  ORF Transcript_115525/g.224773 Transcript_115525/m.224773 type:complete len:102 (-) Transcript_115525:1581-1886(-)